MTAIAIDAVGSGVFMPISMLYFLVATDLSLVQVGAAISLASLVALPTGPLIGSVVDRIGAKQVLLAGNVLQGVGFVAYLFSESFVAVTAWTVVVTLGRTAFWGSYGNIVAAISVPGEREKWFGFLGALRNVGFALGGLVSGVAITIGTDTAYAAVVVANAVSYAVAFVLLLAVPATERAEHQRQPGSWATVLRDGPYRVLWLRQLAFSTSMMVLNFALPVYATTVLGLPGWVTRRGVHDQHDHGRPRPGPGRPRHDRPDPLADPGARQRVLRGVLRRAARRHRVRSRWGWSWCWSAR